MPYTAKDVPDYVAKDSAAQWAKVWNSVYAKAKKDGASDKDAETEAFKQANGVVKKETKSMSAKREVRTISGLKIEVRDGQGDEMALVGYAARFNTRSRNLGGFVEQIAPGAFTQSLKENADVKCTFNHDPNQVLGRTKSGTCTVEQDEQGLKFRCQLDSTNTLHRNIYASVKRGDIDECSFAFTVDKDGQTWADEENGNEDWFAVRTLTNVQLVDVSAVTYPAYFGTSVDARSLSVLFPEGEVPEIRSAVDTLASARAKRSADARAADDKSYQDAIDEIQAAINEAFPQEGNTDGCCYPSGKYWTCETYSDSVIVCEAGLGCSKYFRIAYQKDSAGKYVFGTPEEVEQTWVPATPRGLARVAELRSKIDSIAEEHKAKATAATAEAKAHTDAAAAIEKDQADKKAYRLAHGLMDEEDYEENCLCDPDDVWCDPDDDEDTRKARLEALGVEARAANGKVLTKKVGGKNLTKDKFAFVGDAKDTSTWKYPVHDADHVRNALARWGQETGIPEEKKAGVYRKILAAAAKFGVDVSDDDKKRSLAALPMDSEEIGDKMRKLKALMLQV